MKQKEEGVSSRQFENGMTVNQVLSILNSNKKQSDNVVLTSGSHGFRGKEMVVLDDRSGRQDNFDKQKNRMLEKLTQQEVIQSKNLNLVNDVSQKSAYQQDMELRVLGAMDYLRPEGQKITKNNQKILTNIANLEQKLVQSGYDQDSQEYAELNGMLLTIEERQSQNQKQQQTQCNKKSGHKR